MSSLTEKTDIDEPSFTSKWYIRLIYFLRITGAVCGGLTIALGFISLIVFTNLDPRSVINALYQIIFGLLILLCEARLRSPLKYFAFLRHFLGLGLFYVFVGGLSLGGKWYQLAVGGVEIGLGIAYCILGMFNRPMYDSKEKVNQKLAGTGVTNTGKGAGAKKALPESAFTSDEIDKGKANGTAPDERFPSPLPIDINDVELQKPDKKKSSKNASLIPEPSAPPASTSNRSAYAGNSAVENPFESFDNEAPKFSRGGYAL